MHFTADEFVKGERLIVPDAHGIGVTNGIGINKREFRELLAIVDIGTVGGGGTIDFKLQESDDDGVADPYADIAGAAIAQKTATGTFVGRLDLEFRKLFIRGVLTIGTATVDISVAAALIHANVLPVSQLAASEFSVGS